MKTASYSTYFGPGRIATSVGSPRGIPAGYKMFKPLAPTWDIIKTSADRQAYLPRYRAEILDKLDPQETWDKLHQLAGDAEPVLLCFERPPFDDHNFCHRHMIADWFRETLGHQVDELPVQPRPAKAPKPTLL